MVQKLSEERLKELALAAQTRQFRLDGRFNDIQNLRRNAGNAVKDPEFVAINATADEIFEGSKIITERVFNSQMLSIS